MALRFYTIQILAFVLPFFQVASPVDFIFPAVFNFGDSNSDTGGLVAGVAFPLGLPNGQTYFLEPSGRFCDGRLIIDFLMDVMDLPFLEPYLDSVGAPDFLTGCNFATGGATVLPADAASRNPFSFNRQVAQFVRFRARVLELLEKDRKLEKYLPSEDSFRQGLYMLDVGQNDILGALYSKSQEQVLAFIPTILTEFETGIKKLYSEGARNFWIHNTGPLGCLPKIIATLGKSHSNLDQLGCVDPVNRAATTFNLQLHDLCTKLRLQLPKANVTYVDIFSIKLDLISKFSQYGFLQPIEACCGYGGPPLNFDSRIACGETKKLNGSLVTAEPCNGTAAYVNWDGIHYTEAANEFVSKEILAGNYTDPPLSPNLPFLVRSKLNKVLY